MKPTIKVPNSTPTRVNRWARIFTTALLACGVATQLKAAETWMFATPQPLPSSINLPNHSQATPCLSGDSLTLYFVSDRPGGYGGWDLWMAERSSVDEDWGQPVNLGPTSTPPAWK